MLHANAGHCRWLFDLEKTLNERYSLSIVLLDYTTAPEGQYPRQLNQTVELVDYLLKGGRTPSDVSSLSRRRHQIGRSCVADNSCRRLCRR